MENIKDIKMEEFRSKNGNKILLMDYVGDGDPVSHLDKATEKYVQDSNYIEFIDISCDNPWVRIVVKIFNKNDPKMI